MNSLPSRSLAVVAMSLLVAACGTTPPAFDATAESAKLTQRDAEWSDLATAGKDADGQWRCVVDIANEAPLASRNGA